MIAAETRDLCPDFLAGGGEMGALMRAHDWAATPLGPPETWPQSLRTTIRLALNTRHPVFIFWGPKLTCLYNDAFAATIGPERHPWALGRPGREVWDETWDIIGPQIELVMSGRGATWHEDHLVPITRYGRREDVWWTYSYSPIDDDGTPGGIGGVLVLATDVTAEHRTREALRESEARFRVAADSSPALMWMTDGDGSYVFANARHRSYFGVEAEAMLVDGWHRIIHPEDVEAFLATFREALAAREPFHCTVRVIHPTLGTRWLSCDGNPRHGPDGSFLGYTGVNIDVTDAIQAQAALREAEARSRTLFDAAPFAVIVIDAATYRILDVNDRACTEFGYSREEFLRLSIGDIDALGDSEAIRARARAHAVGPDTQEFEARHRTSSGEIRDVLVRVQGVRLGGRNVFYSAHLDITARKAADARQKLLARELDHRAKNILAVVQAALRLTPRDDPEAYRRAIEGRVGALARAHSLLAETRWEKAELRALLEGELALFLAEQRVELKGPPVTLPPGATQPLAMAVHELGTNAVKHGALSVPDGRVSVSWRLEHNALGAQLLRLGWAETGGPAIKGPPGRRGFGSRVLDATLRVQLGGKVALAWVPEGLTCDMTVPLQQPGAEEGPAGLSDAKLTAAG